MSWERDQSLWERNNTLIIIKRVCEFEIAGSISDEWTDKRLDGTKINWFFCGFSFWNWNLRFQLKTIPLGIDGIESYTIRICHLHLFATCLFIFFPFTHLCTIYINLCVNKFTLSRCGIFSFFPSFFVYEVVFPKIWHTKWSEWLQLLFQRTKNTKFIHWHNAFFISTSEWFQRVVF